MQRGLLQLHRLARRRGVCGSLHYVQRRLPGVRRGWRRDRLRERRTVRLYDRRWWRWRRRRWRRGLRVDERDHGDGAAVRLPVALEHGRVELREHRDVAPRGHAARERVRVGCIPWQRRHRAGRSHRVDAGPMQACRRRALFPQPCPVIGVMVPLGSRCNECAVVQRRDGRAVRGRGPLQITGETNYAYCASDQYCSGCSGIVDDPEEASSSTSVGFATAACVSAHATRVRPWMSFSAGAFDFSSAGTPLASVRKALSRRTTYPRISAVCIARRGHCCCSLSRARVARALRCGATSRGRRSRSTPTARRPGC